MGRLTNTGPAKAGLFYCYFYSMSPSQKVEIRKNEEVLYDELAIERTKMANDRTILSFIRTCLYFSIAGFSFNEFISGKPGNYLGISLFIVAGIILAIGIIRYLQVAKKIRKSISRINSYVKMMDEE